MGDLIGGGRAIRVCDLCCGVDDHPRHTISGGLAEFDRHTPAETTRLMTGLGALRDQLDADQRAELLADFIDTGCQDRHMDCCRQAGCPDGSCNRVTAGAEHLRGAELLQHLTTPPPEVRPGDGGGGGAAGMLLLGLTLAALWARLTLATVGFSQANLINAWLNVLRGTTFTGAAGQFVELHTADPGASGTTAVSSTTTRMSITWNAPSASAISLSASVSWTNWAGTNGEVVSHIAIFSASSAGTFYLSMALTASRTVNTGDTLTLTAASISLSPTAA